MELASPCCSNFPSIISINKSKFSMLCRRLSLPSSSSSSLLLTSKRCNSASKKRVVPSFIQKKTSSSVVCCSQLKVEDDIDNAEACELVNGAELEIGDGNDTIRASLFQAVKNNNGAGILLLTDIFGFEDSYTRDFAYRVACNGYNVLVPDLFRGDPWSKDQSQAQLEQWLAKHDPSRIAADIATATKWMVDEFMAADSSRKLGIIGFCYGGGRVLDVLARDQDSVFDTGVSFYGTRMNLSTASNVKVPVLFVTGDNDPLCQVSILNEFGNVIGNNSKVIVFEGRGHGFVHRPETPEEDADAEEAFMIMRNWLQNQLLE
ncbi:carboxymethylenebutenolidase homolog [Chenopodium quinoa]|nr:carboxymethylenebutenolidase homolog [Chenopodium quinoa]